jgi:GTP cyclohydrolase I
MRELNMVRIEGNQPNWFNHQIDKSSKKSSPQSRVTTIFKQMIETKNRAGLKKLANRASKLSTTFAKKLTHLALQALKS